MTSLLGAIRRDNWERRKLSQDLKAYRFLVATPGDATAGVQLPANGQMAVSSTSATIEGDIVVDVGGELVTIAGGPAGYVFRLAFGERSEHVRVTVHPGQATLYVLDEWKRAFEIAHT